MTELQPDSNPPGAAKTGADQHPASAHARPDPAETGAHPGRRPMYAEYFGLSEAPFSIAPDPHYLYMSEQHQEALAHLLYGVHSDGGFVLLTGEIGTGKTTVCRCFLEQLPKNSEVAFLINPKLNARELLLAICEELCVVPLYRRPPTVKELVDRINAHLLGSHRQGRNTVLIIDEAQNLSMEVLEQMRLLTNLETDKQKLLQVIMIGQPELRDILAQPQLKQLAQRITARYHLGPLSRDEVAAYLRHRLAVAGYHGPLFPARTVRRLYRLSGGIPRVINVLCDRAMLGAYVEGKGTVDRQTLLRAADEVFGSSGSRWHDFGRRHSRLVPWALAFLLIAALATLTYWHRSDPAGRCPPGQQATGSVLNSMPRSVPGPAAAPPGPPELAAGPDEVSEARPEPRLDWTRPPGSMPSAMGVYRALFSQWDLPPGDEGAAMNPCTRALAEGLQCLAGSDASWQELLAFNRPAVLDVTAEDGRSFSLTILRLRGQRLLVDVGGHRYRTSPADLGRHWTGRYTLFWKPPPGYRKELRKGDRGPVVAWLTTRLEMAAGRSLEESDPLVFDQRLLAEVKAFQESERLAADGIVGPQTLIRLNTLTEENVPLLRTGPMTGGSSRKRHFGDSRNPDFLRISGVRPGRADSRSSTERSGPGGQRHVVYPESSETG